MSIDRIPVDPTDSQGRTDVTEPDPGDPSQFDERAQAAADAAADDLHDSDEVWGMGGE